MHEILVSLIPGNNERIWIATGAAIGVAVSFLFGEITDAMKWLCLLIGLDYVTGWVAACRRGELSSRVGLNGICRKMVIFLVVALGNGLDQMSAELIPFHLKDVSIFALGLNEAISLLENVDKLGYGHLIPGFIRDALDALRQRTEKKIARLKDDDE